MDRGMMIVMVRAAGLAALVLAVSAQAQVPTVNIEATCQAAAGVMNLNMKREEANAPNEVDLCLATENGAYQQMIKNFAVFQSLNRNDCVQPRVYLPSYAEWLTCFEMNKAAQEGRQQQGQAMSNFATSAPVTLPPLRTLNLRF